METTAETKSWKVKFLEKNLSSSVFLYTSPCGNQYIAKKSSSSRLRLEFEVLSALDHPNIIKVKGCFDPSDKQFMMMSEYCEHGDMIGFLGKFHQKTLTKNNILTGKFEGFWRYIFQRVLSALLYLEEKNLAHLDVKPENILVTNDFTIKLCDFEFIFPARTTSGEPFLCNYACGTEAYFSPEIKEKNLPYDPLKSEIFSFGVSFLNMMTGGQIFMNEFSAADKRYEFIKNDEFLKFWNSIKLGRYLSSDFRDLMEKMMKYDAMKRIDFDGISKHPWVAAVCLSKDEIQSLLQ